MSNFSAAGRSCCIVDSIQERKTTVVDVSIEAMDASNEVKRGKETKRRREEKVHKHTVMNVLAGQRDPELVDKGMTCVKGRGVVGMQRGEL